MPAVAFQLGAALRGFLQHPPQTAALARQLRQTTASQPPLQQLLRQRRLLRHAATASGSRRSLSTADSGAPTSETNPSIDVVPPASSPAADSAAPFRVYVAAVPLQGWEAAERLLGARYPDALALHTLVVLQGTDGRCTAFDFLPLRPTSPVTASRCDAARRRRPPPEGFWDMLLFLGGCGHCSYSG